MLPPLAVSCLVRFGNYEADLASGELRKGGLKIRLQAQPFRVLAMLLERPGEVVTREDLQRCLWPDHTFVDFDLGLNKAIKKLREALGDSAEGPRYIETLPKRGYRLIASVEARSNVQSLAVLPFENLSRDPKQETFADGMTEALITELAKVNALKITSRTSVMRYKRTKKPLPEVARELNVGAIIEGTVQRSGSHVRITANLLEARTDKHLWAESYEREARDVLEVEGAVARDIAGKIPAKLTPP